MKKKALAVTLFLALFSVMVGVRSVKAHPTPFIPLLGDINITSPSNITYSSNLLILNITVQSLFGPNEYRFVMVYSIDGENNATIPLTTTIVPIEATFTYANGTTTTGTSIFSPYVTAGSVALPELPEGSHKLTVYANYERTSTNHNYPALILDSSTVYFTVNDGHPPIISSISIQNKTYNQNSLLLNFTTDEPTSWTGYCLDGKTNITFAGNTTLSWLPDGSHSVVIYANDTAGNLGAFETVIFTVDTPEPFPTTLIATIITSVVIIGAVMLVYFRKRNHAKIDKHDEIEQSST